MNLAGLIVISDDRRRMLTAAKREVRRVGVLRFLDVIAYRAFARLRLQKGEHAWKQQQLASLRTRYPADLSELPRLVVSNPNERAAREFLTRLQPDIVIARCKFILKPEIFSIARVGTFALHPGICPEYRNAHGCFWALVRRDLDRVGMTLLKIDKGIDTGPVYLHAGCDMDEAAESHIVIQYRAVLANLDRIASTLIRLYHEEKVDPVPTAGRASAVWGQPTLTDYLRWKKAARRVRNANASGVPAVS